MYLEKVPNRNSPPAVLVRESYREDGKVKKRTLANLSKLPPELIEKIGKILKGGKVIEEMANSFEITKSRGHGQVMAVWGMAKKLGLPKIIGEKGEAERNIVLAMVISRILNAGSKLATARYLNEESGNTTLGEMLGLGEITEEELYKAMDWLGERQEKIEKKLAEKHLKEGEIILYDVTSTYMEGKKCQLGKYGYNRDKKRGKVQIVWGMLCNKEGCPVAVEVWSGNTSDTKTLGEQIRKVKEKFGIEKIVWVGDKGMITETRIREEMAEAEGIEWITSLRRVQIKELLKQEEMQLSLFDEKNLVEIESEEYAGERLIVCRNPILAEKRRGERKSLIDVAEKELEKIAIATQRKKQRLTGKTAIAMRLGKLISKNPGCKYFSWQIEENSFVYSKNEEKIEEENKLDGVYVIRTSVPPAEMSATTVVKSYKTLSKVEQAFRCCKSMDLKVRPIYHYLENRVKAHVFLCMLAYYVEWHLRELLAPLLFEESDSAWIDEEPSTVMREKEDAIHNKAKKGRKKRTEEGLPIHSFQTLLANLGTITMNWIQPIGYDETFGFEKITKPTVLQEKVFELLGVPLVCTQTG